MAEWDPKTCNHVFIEKEYYECEYCNKQFSTAFNLNRHQKGNCRENVCGKCNIRFQKADQLNEHILTCSGRQAHQCEFCAKSFQKNSNLCRHRQTHTEKCEKCGAVFYKRLPLLSMHPNESTFECQHCADTFKSKELLDQHLEDHLYLFTNKCEACPLAFSKKRQLLKHKQKFHPKLIPQSKNRKTYPCSLCERCFYLYRDLKNHLKIHIEQGDKMFKCKICGKGYTRTTSLKMHMFKHASRENRPRCDICKKVFSHPYCLRAHMRIHTNQRPYNCSTCSKSFRQQGHLIRHRLTHMQKNQSGPEQECKTCHKKFKDVTSLKIHATTHIAVRKYTCDYCSKSFRSKRTLADHVNIHTGSKPYKCTLCPQAFPYSGQLYKHRQTHKQSKSQNSVEQNHVVQADSNPQQCNGMIQPTVDPATFTLMDSVVLPVQMSIQGQPLSIHNQLQPIYNTVEDMSSVPRPEGFDQLALQHVQLQLQSPVNMVKAHQKPPGDMPTYWHVQQSNLVQYHSQNQDMKAVFIPPNNINVQASIAPSTIEVISNSMQHFQNPISNDTQPNELQQ